MGPQLKGCGRFLKALREFKRVMLQWGRSLRAAEGAARGTRCPTTSSFNGAAA